MGIAYAVTSDKIGNQDAELGTILMNNLIRTLVQAEMKPTHFLLMERGVRLCTEEFPALDALQELEKEGVKILACGTCVDYYDLNGKLAVGEVSNMATIIQAMHTSDKVMKF